MQINPTEGNLLIQLEEVKTQTESGLYYGAALDNVKQCRGTVIAGEVFVGLRVALNPAHDVLFLLEAEEGGNYVIVKTEDVVATIED